MDINDEFFKIDYKEVLPQRGRLLISEPFLNDSYFKRSIVFITEHGDDGTVGFVLNKPVKIKSDELFPDIKSFETQISVGGPVGTNTIHYIHTLGDIIPNSIHIWQNIYWGGDFNAIRSIIETGRYDPAQIRFFIGYSGWQPEQLNRELEENSWIVTSQPSSFIMKPDTSTLWKQALSSLGSKYEVWSNFPEDPGYN